MGPKGYTSQIVALLSDGMNANDVAGVVGCRINNVYATAKRYNLPTNCRGNLPLLDDKKEEIKKFIKAGLSLSEIARRYGADRNNVRAVCRRYGIEYDKERKPQNKYTEEQIAEIVSQYGALYVDGYENNKDPFRVKCLDCNKIFRTSLHSLRYYNRGCPYCREEREREEHEQRAIKTEAKRQESEKRKREREREQEHKRQEKEAEKQKKRLAKMHACPVCGTITDRPKYCSDKCANKAENKRREVQRRRKIAAAMVDNDITVRGLYRRDGGRCYICGLVCSLDDYICKDGATICGDWYPSIDHVIPLSKGGLHSWSNVRLAHRKCNSWKSDTIYNPPQHS